MNFTDIFIKRPVFATVISLLIILVGAKSYFSLPMRLYPKVDSSVVTINAAYTGADAELMEGFIATPLENALAGIDGIDYMTSSSSSGDTNVAVHFNLGYDINVAVADVNSKVNSARWKLPRDMNDPIVSKRDFNDAAIMYLSFASNTMSPEEVTDYLERIVQPQMQTLNGVAQAEILGAREYAMRIWLDPKLMAGYNIAFNDIKNVLSSGNLQSPSGPLKSAWENLNVKTYTDLHTSEEFNNLIIKDSNGQTIKIKDIGKAELGAKDNTFSFIMNNKQVVGMAIYSAPTANPLDVAKAVKKMVPELAKSMPSAIHPEIIWDNSVYIDSSIKEVKKTVVEAVLCVIAIVFIFICSWRILLIPIVTIPISLIGVFSIMHMLGYSLNTITYLSLVLAIGMVVDDAIVVSENIHRHISLGKSVLDSAIIGAREIQFAVISMTLTLAAVYAPIGFLTGLVGSLFKEFAFTLASTVIISGFVALTLSPMMCSKFMNASVMDGKFAQTVHHQFDRIMRFYKKLLLKVLAWRKTVLVVIVVILGSSFWISKYIPSELAPKEDTGGIMTIVTAPTTAGLNYVEKYTQQLPPIYNGIPEKTNFFVVNGMQGENTAMAIMILKPWDQRKRTSEAIIKELFPKLWSIPGVLAFPISPSMLPGASGFKPINLVIQSTGSYSELSQVIGNLSQALSANPRIVNVDTDLKLDQTQINLNINRNKAGDFGIPISDVGDAVGIALSEGNIGHFSIQGRSYDVIPQLALEYRQQPDTLNLIYLRTHNGDLVPLSNFVSMHEILQPKSLNHFQQIRSATLTASVAPGYTIGEAFTYLQQISDKIVPKNMQINYSGELRQYTQSSGDMRNTFLFALVFIFLILAAQFESFRDPFVVLFTVPLSVFGALLALKLTGNTLNIFSQIGLVTLIGLITKHGILMVEFANQLQDQGKDIYESIIESATIRLRPVLMTTGAMVLGAIPLACASGAGSISRQQIGWVIIGGMTIGTFFTLFVVPTMYTYLAKKRFSIKKI